MENDAETITPPNRGQLRIQVGGVTAAGWQIGAGLAEAAPWNRPRSPGGVPPPPPFSTRPSMRCPGCRAPSGCLPPMKACALPAKPVCRAGTGRRQDRTVTDLGGAVPELLEIVRRRFYAQQPPTHFHRDRRMLVYALTWPAGWLDSRGLTYSPARAVLIKCPLPRRTRGAVPSRFYQDKIPRSSASESMRASAASTL
jgi:hypothetical protein